MKTILFKNIKVTHFGNFETIKSFAKPDYLQINLYVNV